MLLRHARNGNTLRIATYIPKTDLLGLIQQAGCEVKLHQLVEVPSICCGGCGG
jgi:hypothetical protein